MNLPSGLVFFLDFQYGTSKTPFTVNQSLYGTKSSNFGNTNAGGLYGAGRFGYSIQNTSSVATGTTGSAVATWADFDFDSDYSSSYGTYEVVSIAATQLSNADATAVRGFQLFSGSTSTTPIQVSAFTKVDSGNLVMLVATSDVDPPAPIATALTVYVCNPIVLNA